MNNDNISEVQTLLTAKAELASRLKLIPYQGTLEIKEKNGNKYIYLRKKELGKVSSLYIDKYGEELFTVLLKQTSEAKELKKQIRIIDNKLAKMGVSVEDLPPETQLNLEFARINMKANIYDQAILEGVATTFPQTETIIDNGIVSGMSATDVQKILNLKHAWEFILDKNVLSYKSDLYLLSYIAKIVNEGFYFDGGKLRVVPVRIGGSSYVPPLPNEITVKENIEKVLQSATPIIDKAINLCLYCMKTQIFNDGNKRAAVIFANHYLISQGEGLLIISEKDVPAFKKLLVDYYEDKNPSAIVSFMKENCWRKLK